MIMISSTLYIVKEEWTDDGTTGGKTVLVANDGSKWVKTNMTKETCGTGDTVRTLRDGRIY